MDSNLVWAIQNIESIGLSADNEDVAVYYPSEIGGPQGQLPIASAAVAIRPATANAMHSLADALETSSHNFSVSFKPADIGLAWTCTDLEIPADVKGTWRWTDKKYLRLDGQEPGINDANIVFTKEGNIWLQLAVDGIGCDDTPSCADIHISREALRAIGDGKPGQTRKLRM